MDGLNRYLFRWCLLVTGLCISLTQAGAQTSQVWTNLGLYGGHIYDIAVDPGNPDRIFAGSYLGEGLFLSRDGGRSWTPVEMENVIEGEDTFKNHAIFAVKIAPSDNNIIWVAHNYWVAKSTDGGNTWTHIQNRDIQRDCRSCGGEGDNFRFCRSLAVDPSNPQVVYVGTGGPYGSYPSGAVYRSDDGGLTWTKTNQGNNLDQSVVDLDIDPQNSSTIWAVTSSFGTGGWSGTLYRSQDRGDTWSPVFPLDSGYSVVRAAPNDSNIVFTGSGYGVIKHYYDGTTWRFAWPLIPDSRLASAVEFDPQDPDTLYAAWLSPTAWGGDGLPKISRSTDGGINWETYLLDKQTVSEIASLAVHPTDSSVLLAGDYNLGVLTSQDNGRTWTPINEGINAVIVYDVAVDPQDSAHFLASAISGIYEKKGAESWTRLTNSYARAVVFDPTDSSIIYGGSFGYVIRTVDGGKTWSFSNDLGPEDVYDLAVDPVDPANLFAAVGQKVFRSTDGGMVFADVLEGINLSGEDYSFNVVTFDPIDPRHVFAGGGNFYAPRIDGDLWESFDHGDTWQKTGLTNVIVNDLLIDPQNSKVLYAGCGYSGGTEDPVLRSADGGVTWSPAHEGFPASRNPTYAIWGLSSQDVYIIGYHDVLVFDGTAWTQNSIESVTDLFGIWGVDGSNLFAVGSSGTITRYDGTHWALMPAGSTARLNDIWGTASNNVYAVGRDGTILHYDGAAWTVESSGTSETLEGVWGTGPDNIFVVGDKGTILHVDGRGWTTRAGGSKQDLSDVWAADRTHIFAVGSEGTILRFDGTNWTPMTSGTTDRLRAVWGSSAANVYAAGTRGVLLHYDGADWSPIDLGVSDQLLGIWGSSASDVFVISDTGGIFHFDGISWGILREPGRHGNAVTDLEFHPKDPDIIYAGSFSAGVYISPNQSRKWVNLGTPDFNVFAISAGSLYAATEGGLLQCTGTGLIAGRVTQYETGDMVHQATVYNDFGIKTLSVNGEYIMVSPAGICTITAVADGRSNTTVRDVTVFGSDVSWVNLAMESGVSGAATDTGTTHSSSGGGYGCFIHTITQPANQRVPGAAALFMIVLSWIALLLQRRLGSGGKKSTLIRTAVCIVIASLIGFTQDRVDAATLFEQVGVASSPNPVGSGARAMGMAGAFIAVADDATAASWNPAGLIQLEKPEVSVVGAYYQRREEFTSNQRPEIDNTGNVDEANLNYLSAAVPFHFFRNIVVSLCYQRLYEFRRQFSYQLNFADAGLDVVQNKDFKQDGYVGALGLAAAIEITPRLSLGATFNLWTDQLFWDNSWDEKFTERSQGTLGDAPVTIDTSIEDEYSRFRGINFNVGLLWNIISGLTVGAVVKTPFTASLRHQFNFSQSQTFGAPVDTTTTSRFSLTEDVDLDMPLSYGIGLAWRFSDVLTVAADVYRTDWSDYILEDSQGNKFSPIDGRPENDSDVEDTTQARLGAEYLFLFPERNLVVPLRAGFFYDPEPADGDVKDFYGLALGSGLTYKRFVFDIAYQYRWGNDVDTGNLIATSEADIRQHSVLASLIFHF